jgi:hypothetical protein
MLSSLPLQSSFGMDSTLLTQMIANVKTPHAKKRGGVYQKQSNNVNIEPLLNRKLKVEKPAYNRRNQSNNESKQYVFFDDLVF